MNFSAVPDLIGSAAELAIGGYLAAPSIVAGCALIGSAASTAWSKVPAIRMPSIPSRASVTLPHLLPPADTDDGIEQAEFASFHAERKAGNKKKAMKAIGRLTDLLDGDAAV